MEDIEIKNEFFTNYRTASCCHACLSTERVLSTLTEYIDIYYKICDNQNMNPPSETYLCWECIALLKKLRMFRRKVAQAQRTLQLHYINKQDFHSLSSLTTYLIAENTEIKLTHEESGIKPIKQETEEPFEDNVDYTDNIKDESDDETDVGKIDIIETKVEIPNVPETSKYNKRNEYNMKRIMNRNAKYRFLNIKLKKHRRLLVRKVPIKLNEVLTSLEEERCDGSFVTADHKCLYCVAVWDCEDGLEKHNKKWHDESNGSYQCHICHVRCPSQDKLRAHETSHYYRRECKICRAQCCSPSGMDKHLEKHHRMVQCLACELCFRNVRLFYNHYKALHAAFVCDLCGKRCKSRTIIEKHLRHHFGYECPYCKKKLRNSTSYKNHVETQHSSSVSDNAYCVPCDRRFSSDRMYKRHLQTSAAHARERDNTRAKRKYPCPECSNVYSRRTYMNNHYRHVHAKQSKYYCEDCDRHFLNRTRFIDHRRFQHEGAKRDKDKLCNICGRGFAANRTLINHIRTHSGERPFACEYCGAKFTQKHAMLSHVKYIHLKSKRKSSWHE